jgi:transposase
MVDPVVEDTTRRGDDPQPAGIFRDIAPEARVPHDHPLRTIRTLADAVLQELAPRFDTWSASTGRPAIAPETLLRALLLQVL